MNSRIESLAKYAGLATVAAEWSALIIYYIKAPLYFNGQYPISFFATLPETRWAFTTCYVLAAVFFWIFTKHHLARRYDAPVKVFGSSMAFFAATGIFPYDPQNPASLAVHTGLALSSGALFVTGMYLIGKRSKDALLFKVTNVFAVLSVVLTLALLLSPKASHLTFALESGSWLMIQIWIIWFSFYIHKS